MNMLKKIEAIKQKAAMRNENNSENNLSEYEKTRMEWVKQDEAKRKSEQLEEFLDEIPSIYHDITFDDFVVVCADQETVKNILQRFIDTFDIRQKTKTNLIFYGNTGTGKTMLSLILCQLICQKSYEVKYEGSLNFLRELKEKSFESHKAFIQILEYYKRIPLLVIDEAIESLVTGDHLANWEKEMLFAVINARYQEKTGCTLIITNRTQDEIADRLGERITDRLLQNAITLAFNWNSYRKK